MQASPLQQVIDRFGGTNETDKKEARKQAKNALVAAVRGYMKKDGLLDEDLADKGLERVSNRKLIKLLELAEKVENNFGSRSALIDKVAELEKREKDGGFREHLEKYRLPGLYDRYEAAAKRA
jgi:hypothetical protein